MLAEQETLADRYLVKRGDIAARASPYQVVPGLVDGQGGKLLGARGSVQHLGIALDEERRGVRRPALSPVSVGPLVDAIAVFAESCLTQRRHGLDAKCVVRHDVRRNTVIRRRV